MQCHTATEATWDCSKGAQVFQSSRCQADVLGVQPVNHFSLKIILAHYISFLKLQYPHMLQWVKFFNYKAHHCFSMNKNLLKVSSCAPCHLCALLLCYMTLLQCTNRFKVLSSISLTSPLLLLVLWLPAIPCSSKVNNWAKAAQTVRT